MATVAQLLSQLEGDKETLVNNLNTKGVTATNEETFTELVPKVLEISDSGGITPDKIIQNGDYEYIETAEISPSNDIGFHAISAPITKSIFYEAGAGYEMNITNDDMAAYLHLTPDKLVQGYTILGVDGTAVNLDTSDANATSEQILEGYSAYVNGVKVEGEILKKSESTIVPGTIDVTISRGLYMDGTQTIKGDQSLISDNIKAGTTIFNVPGKSTVIDTESDMAIMASEMLQDKEAFVNGEKIVGTVKPLSNNGQVVQTAEIDYLEESANIGLTHTYSESKLIKANDKVIYQVPKETLAETIGLNSNIIKSGTKILGIEGTLTETGIDTSDATATNDKILEGYTAYVDGQKITGNIPSKTAETYIPSTVNQEIASAQYLSEPQIIIGDENLIAENIKKDIEIFGVTGTYAGSATQSEQIILDCRNMTTADEVLSEYQNSIVVSNDGAYSVFEPIGNFVYNIISVGRLQDTSGISFNAQTVPAGFYFKQSVNITSQTTLLNIIFYVSTWVNPKITVHFVDGDTDADIQQNIISGTYAYTSEITLANGRNNTFDLIRLDNIPLGTYHIFVEVTTKPTGNEFILNYLSVVEL